MASTRPVLSFDQQEILHRVSPATLQFKALSYALELAILGGVDQARILMSTVYELSPVTHVSIALRHGLCYAWLITGNPPDGVEKSSVEEYVKMMTVEYDKYRGGDLEQQDRTLDKHGLEACMRYIGTHDPDLDMTSDLSTVQRSQVLVRALDILLKLYPERISKDQREGLEQSLVEAVEQQDALIARMLRRWSTHDQVYELGVAQRLWPWFLNGIIADAAGMSPEQVRSIGQELVGIFHERYKVLRSERIPQTMLGILEALELNTLCGPGAESEDWVDVVWGTEERIYFRDGASQEDIARLEQKLDTQLPEDYKEFLRTTNGFGFKGSGIFNGYWMDPALWPAEKVAWCFDEHIQRPVELLGDLPTGYDELVPRKKRKTQPEDRLDWSNQPLPIFDKALALGHEDVLDIYLVHPELVKQTATVYNEMYRNASEEQKEYLMRCIEELAGSKAEFDNWVEKRHWCCVKLTGGESMTAYASFEDYLKKMLTESAATR